MGWCNDVRSHLYNREFKIRNNIRHEKLYRKDYKYDYFINIKYNDKKIVKGKGSALFLHLTKKYNPTAGCIALKKKDFLILAKLLEKENTINIY